jgi:hypothetical protein
VVGIGGAASRWIPNGWCLAGTVYVIGALNFELVEVYSLFVRASDNPTNLGKDTQRQTDHSILVTVVDVNDHVPIFSQNGNYAGVVDENSASGTAVITVSATDGDQQPGSSTVQVGH